MSQHDLYVGYLPLPKKHKHTLRALIPFLFITLLAASALIAYAQRDPGPAVWHTANEQSFTGLISANPYPSIRTDNGTYLVVEMGKHGSQQRLDPLHNQRATLTGYLLEREGRRMIELAPADDAINPLGQQPAAEPRRVFGPEITLTGEILDSKCYLGAMKPGDGKAHKACATLCIDAGIPPMLYATNPDGTRSYFVLTDKDLNPAPHLIRDYLAEPVTVRGTPLIGNTELLLLTINESSIKRIGK